MGAFILPAQVSIRIIAIAIAIAIAIGIEELILRELLFDMDSDRKSKSFTYSLIFFGSQRSFFFFFLTTAPQSLQR